MATSAELAGQIAQYDSKRINSVDATNEALAQFGVPEIRKNVAGMRTTIANTQNSLNAVDPSVTGRTSQSLVTEAQRSKMVNNERAPIAQQLSDQNQIYGQASQDLSEALGQATTLANNKVRDWETGRQALQSQYDTTYKSEQDSLANQIAQEQMRRQQVNADREYSLAAQKASSNGKDVDPAQELLQYVGGQFKAAGGQGNTKISRQQQDAWIESWLNQNGVSKANRQGYWDLINKTYNRSADPTKDPRYKK